MLVGLALWVLELATEVLKVWVEDELNVESALEALVEDVDRKLLCLDPSSLRQQILKFLRFQVPCVQSEFVAADTFVGLQEIKVNILLHVLLEAVDE